MNSRPSSPCSSPTPTLKVENKFPTSRRKIFTADRAIHKGFGSISTELNDCSAQKFTLNECKRNSFA